MKMDKQVRDFIQKDTQNSMVVNFAINGMFAAVLNHKADAVAVDALAIAVDLTITCMLICVLSAFANLLSVKQSGITYTPEPGSRVRRLGGLLRHPVLFGVTLGVVASAVSSVLFASLFALLGVPALSFYVYVGFKSLFGGAVAGIATALELYAGVIQYEK